MLRAQCRVANCCKVPITLWNIKSDNLSNQSTFVSIVIRFPDIGGETLEKIIKYLHYKDKYSNSTTRIPEFQIDPDEVRGVLLCIFCLQHFISESQSTYLLVSATYAIKRILMRIIKALELLVAANYLNC